MKTLKFDTEEQWLEARRGKLTGTKAEAAALKRGGGKRIGYYEIIAEKLAIEGDGENPMDRGHRLEEESMQRLSAVTEQKIDTSLVLWQRDDNPNIAYSPDGIINKAVAAESKSLSSARHIEAYLTQQVPDEFYYQKLQAFIVNDDLKKLYFCFYDPRMGLGLDFFYITVNRKDLQEEIDKFLQQERDMLAEIQEIVTRLTF